MKKINNQGQGLTEYITLLILVSLVAVGAAQGLGSIVKKKIAKARDHIRSDINFDGVNDK